MAGEQDRQGQQVAEIRAGRDAGGRTDRSEDGTGTGPKRRRSAPRSGAGPRRAKGVAAAAPLLADRPEAPAGGGVARPRRKVVPRGTGLVASTAPGGGGGSGPVRVPGLRRLGLCAAMAALWVLGGCGGGVSGEIGQACVTSGREAASRQLCSCVQGVANQTLSPADQRRVARFFGNPDEAEAVRASDSARDEAFWDRFQNFTDTAEAICG